MAGSAARVPFVMDPLSAYTAALEEGKDPLEAHAAAFGEEGSKGAEEDPAEAYCRLLATGWAPDAAWEGTYGGGKSLKKGPPGDVLFLVPPDRIKTDSVWFDVVTDPEAGEGYTSYIYRVAYLYRDTSSRWMWTYARVDIPDVDFSTIDTIGVVLVVEGDLRHEVGVNQEGEAEETWYETKSRLAGGRRFSEDADADASLPYRDQAEGTAIIVVSFTQPGRGPEFFQATGDPECVGLTPDNYERGRDWWGETTLRAMDAVMTLAQTVTAECEAACSGNPITRTVVLSTSAGLIAASAWAAQGLWPIHALVDTEGPSDSTEACGTHMAWTEEDLGASIQDTFTGEYYRCEMPTDLSWEQWTGWAKRQVADWILRTSTLPESFPFWYRPPLLAVADASAVTTDSAFLDLLDGAFAAYGGAGWFRLLAMPLGNLALGGLTKEFWETREPYRNLPAALGSGTAYIRIQGRVNHAEQQTWYQCRNAIRNLHAAWEATGGARVYYADQVWVETIRGESISGGITSGPTRMTKDLDPDVYQEGTWPEWPLGRDAEDIEGEVAAEFATFEYRFFATRAWQAQVDVIRWALGTDFS